jgi:uncharacterized protein YdeI (YjbR/CyaY-like superfamily)
MSHLRRSVRGMDPTEEFATAKDFEAWLAASHATSTGVWLRMAKKATGVASVTYQEALDVALCYGWIDSQKRSDGPTHWLQRFGPRTRRSGWSKVNREHVERLIAAGRMTPAGLREVEAARADGRWAAAYDPPSKATVPDDLRAALDANPAAAAFFATLDSRNRFSVLHRVTQAKKPETRAARIATFVEMLGRGEKIYP